MKRLDSDMQMSYIPMIEGTGPGTPLTRFLV